MVDYATLFGDVRTSARSRARPAPLEALHARGLTAQQVAAVSAPADACIVVHAGAGTGKTRTLAERAAWLLRQGVRASDLMVCTFTRAAAQELSSRIGTLLGDASTLPYCGTIHALALQLLGGTAGLAARGARLLSDEQYQTEALALAQMAPPSLAHLNPAELLGHVQRTQEERHGPADLQALAQAWTERLVNAGQWDFVLLLTATLAEAPRRRFRHLLVDEAQDLSALQLEWLLHHRAPGASLYLVGDENQSLYAFRGSRPGLLTEHVQAGATLYRIDENFRCARSVLEHANHVIAFNANPLAGALRAARDEPGWVQVRAFEHTRDEAQAAARALTDHPSHVVLVRTRELFEPFAAFGLRVHTIHEAKGLEWDQVWVAGLELGVLPHVLGERAEERRLCYVAMTRARDALTLSYVRERVLGTRTVHYAPSPFLYESQALEVR
jgi:DNA helicase-2/ATP-dependent DNA helicase PcrA